MPARFVFSIAMGLVGATLVAADENGQLKVVPSRAIPVIESVSVYRLKDGKREAAGKLTTFDQPLALSDEGPFEIEAKPKGGLPIRIAEKVTVKRGQTHEMKLGELIGCVEVFGDNFPRAEKIVLTEEKDPGPGEKGHVAVQVASDYRVEMAVPPGFYAVWIVPANGARAQRVADRVRVYAGKSVREGE